jgi:drug/metabolite transporter (DMT)-like permease
MIFMAFELSILAAFGAMLCWGVGDFFIQRSTRNVGDFESLAFIGIIGSIIFFPFALSELHLLFSIQIIALLFFIGVFSFFPALLEFEGLKKGKLSVIDLVMTVELPLTVLLGILLFNEALSLLQFALILLIFLGIILVSVNSFSNLFSFKLEKGVIFVFVGSIAMAFLNFFIAFGSRTVSPLMVMWVPSIVFTGISLAVIWKRKGLTRFSNDIIKFKKSLLAMGLLDNLAWFFFAVALFSNGLSITTAITESYPVIAVFFGVIINKEKIVLHQYAGIILTLISSFGLAFFI